MILELVAGGAVLGGGYAAYKHYGSAKVIAAVKAEVAKVEAEASTATTTLTADAKAAYTAVAARIKKLL